MAPRIARMAVAVLVLALSSPLLGGAEIAFQSQSTFSTINFSASPTGPVKLFPALDMVVPVPGTFDPSAANDFFLECFILVMEEGSPIKKAKGRYEFGLVLINERTGTGEAAPLDSGRFKTGKDGRADRVFEVPADVFTDISESGDLAVWSYVRAEFVGRKKANQIRASCAAGASRED